MKAYLMKFLTWLSATVTVASILHWLPVMFGIVGSFFWMGVAYYKRHQSKTEDQKASVDLQISELQLEVLVKKHSVNIVHAPSGSCSHDDNH